MTQVIKVGGRVQADPRLAGVLAQLWAKAPGSFCVVHGGGETISTLQAQLGRAPQFVRGRRVTTQEDIEVLRMALSGVANKKLVSSLSAEGIPAAGVSGEDGSLLEAQPMNAAELGKVGEVTRVNELLLTVLFSGGFLPVISPVARNVDGAHGALNVNADDAAAAIAVALDADELLLVSDVPGVLIDGVAVNALSAEDALRAIESGTAFGGMATKLEAAVGALARGVRLVRIGGLEALLDPASGTTLVAERQLA